MATSLLSDRYCDCVLFWCFCRLCGLQVQAVGLVSGLFYFIIFYLFPFILSLFFFVNGLLAFSFICRFSNIRSFPYHANLLSAVS